VVLDEHDGAGMFPVMIFLMMGRDMRAMEPTSRSSGA
jgi:hypothetical protein